MEGKTPDLLLALTAFVGLWVTAANVDFDALGNRIIRAPADPSRYDDDPVRWGVIATVFWGMAGFLAGLLIALYLQQALQIQDRLLSWWKTHSKGTERPGGW